MNANEVYRFDDCELDPARAELWRAGSRVHVQPKALSLLVYLIQHRERVVTKDELFSELWADATVTEASLSRAVSVARAAIGDHERIRVLSVPRRGYRFGGEPRLENRNMATAADAPAGNHGPRGGGADVFVGRDAELQRLAAARARAGAGCGGVVLVTGPAGVGKSRLLEVFCDDARRRGNRVVTGRASGTEGAPAFWTWVQVLRDLATQTRHPDALQLLDHLVDGEGGVTAVAESVERRRFLFFDAVSRVLKASAVGHTLVIALEDLQECRRPSLALLDHVAREVSGASILIVGTIRDSPRAPEHPLNATLAILGPLDWVASAGLAGFTRGEVARLFLEVIGRDPPERLLDELMRRTEGNPLFLREALRQLQEANPAVLGEGLEMKLAPLPGRTVDIVNRQLGALSPQCMQLIEAAAVLGRDFAIAQAGSLAGLDPSRALDLADTAVLRGVVCEVEEHPGTYRFAHGLFQEAAYACISPGQRARLHACAAEHLERRSGGHGGPVLAELARHTHRALPITNPERAFAWAVRAAQRARGLFAHEQAAVHYEQALDALSCIETCDPARVFETLLSLGEVLRLSGNRLRRREVVGQAAAMAESRRDADGLARAAILFCDMSEWCPSDAAGVALLELALVSAPERLRPRLSIRLAYLSVTDRPLAIERARKALELARRSAEPDTLQEGLYAMHLAYSGPDALDERARIVAEMAELAPRLANRDLAVVGLVDLSCDRLVCGDTEGAGRSRVRAAEVAGEKPHPGIAWHLACYDVGMHLLRGEIDAGERAGRECLALGQIAQHPYARATFRVQRLLIRRMRGRPREAVQRQRAALAAEPEVTEWPYALAVNAAACAEAGRMTEARGWVERLAREDLTGLIGALDWTAAASELATALCLLHDVERAEALYGALLPHAHLHAVSPVPVFYNGPLEGSLARLARTLGRADAALAHCEAAIHAAEGMGARPAQASLMFELASLLDSHGRSREARRLSAEALRLAERLGAPGLVPRGAAGDATGVGTQRDAEADPSR